MQNKAILLITLLIASGSLLAEQDVIDNSSNTLRLKMRISSNTLTVFRDFVGISDFYRSKIIVISNG